MHEFAVAFTVAPERRDDFIKIALQTGREALANEPGTRRFELIADETDRNRFYLSEAYDDVDAFHAHADGPYFRAFFTDVSAYAEGPEWLLQGTRLELTAAA